MDRENRESMEEIRLRILRITDDLRVIQRELNCAAMQAPTDPELMEALTAPPLTPGTPPPYTSRCPSSRIQPLPTAPQIRTAEASDAPAIAHLVNAAFRSERFFIDADRTDPQNVRTLLEKGKFLMLFEEDVLAGCVCIELRGERGYFGLLAVEPQRQLAGIGARLIAAAQQLCRSARFRFLDLTLVNVRLELPAYYQRFGYAENGVLPFPADQVAKIPAHLVRMSKAL